MEQMPEQRRRTKLEGVLSLDYDACNQLAHTTNQLAQEKLAGPIFRQDFYIFDDTKGETPTPVDVVYVGSASELRNHYRTKGGADFYLGITRKVTEVPGENDPQLFMLIRDDLVVPLATFGTRRGGSCSFIQLGQEAHDDNFIVTPRDQRKGIINGIRDLLTGSETETNAQFNQFVLEEVANRHTELAAQLAPAVSRLAFGEYSDEPLTLKPLWLLGEDGQRKRQATRLLFRGDPFRLADGRPTELGLISFPQSELLQMVNIVRDDVALPLVEFKRSGPVDAISGKELDVGSVELVRRVICAGGNNARAKLEMSQVQYQPKKLVKAIRKNGTDGDIRNLYNAAGIAKAILDKYDPETASSATDLRRYDGHYYKQTCEEIEKSGHLSNSLNNTLTLGRRKLHRHTKRLIDLVESRQALNSPSVNNPEAADLMRRLRADDRLREWLGPYSFTKEQLLKSLGGLATNNGRRYVGIKSNIGEDRVSAEVAAELESPDGTQTKYLFETRLYGRDLAFSPVFKGSISRIEAIDIPMEDVVEMQDLVGLLDISSATPANAESAKRRILTRLGLGRLLLRSNL